MTILTVGKDLPLSTLAAAAAVVKAGDVVEIETGVYRERLIANVAGVTWKAADGHAPILDGGYSHQWARGSGDNWRNLVYKAPTATMGDVVVIRADGVTVEGLRIQNAGGAGVSVGAFKDIAIRNNDIFHTYETAIVVNGGAGVAENVLIEGNRCNVASVKIFHPERTGGSPQNVSGVVKAGNCRGVVIRGNVISRGFGEGVNVGKDARDMTVEGNEIFDCNHIHLYVNRGINVNVTGNLIFQTGDPAHLYTDGDAPGGLALRDEETRGGTFPTSKGVRFANNTVVNCGYPLLLNAEDGAAADIVVDANTFVWGPLTRQGITIVGPQGGVFTGNTLHTLAGVPTTANNPAGITFRANRWRFPPPAAWRGENDVYGDTGLAAPGVMPTAEHDGYGMGTWYEIDPANYAPEGTPPPAEPPPSEVARIQEELATIADAVGLAQMELTQALARLARLSESIK